MRVSEFVAAVKQLREGLDDDVKLHIKMVKSQASTANATFFECEFVNPVNLKTLKIPSFYETSFVVAGSKVHDPTKKSDQQSTAHLRLNYTDSSTWMDEKIAEMRELSTSLNNAQRATIESRLANYTGCVDESADIAYLAQQLSDSADMCLNGTFISKMLDNKSGPSYYPDYSKTFADAKGNPNFGKFYGPYLREYSMKKPNGDEEIKPYTTPICKIRLGFDRESGILKLKAPNDGIVTDLRIVDEKPVIQQMAYNAFTASPGSTDIMRDMNHINFGMAFTRGSIVVKATLNYRLSKSGVGYSMGLYLTKFLVVRAPSHNRGMISETDIDLPEDFAVMDIGSSAPKNQKEISDDFD